MKETKLANKMLREESWLSSAAKRSCERQARVFKKKQRKITYSMNGNKAEVYFVLAGIDNKSLHEP